MDFVGARVPRPRLPCRNKPLPRGLFAWTLDSGPKAVPPRCVAPTCDVGVCVAELDLYMIAPGALLACGQLVRLGDGIASVTQGLNVTPWAGMSV